jgi:hypothetical protein
MAFRLRVRLTAGAVLLGAATAAQAARIDLVRLTAGQPDFHTCGTAAPLGPPLAIGVYAVLGSGVEGISGAELFIRTQDLEAYPLDLQAIGWTLSVQANPAARASVGNPIVPDTGTGIPVRRANIVFSVDPETQEGCQGSDTHLVLLYRIGILNFSHPENPIPPDTQLVVVGADPPGNPQFRCPLVNLCDGPSWTKVCVSGGQFIINPSGQPCTDAVSSQSWGSVKALYR